MADATIVSKRIVICCDGTWQSSVSGEANVPSNVTRLCRYIARTGKDDDGKIWQQLVYYDSGVGTGSLNTLEKQRQGAVGDGLAVNVIEAYNFIVNNYSPGDEIFCFGFSRGAYTARAVAGLVADIGIVKPKQMQLFPELYDIYKKNVPSKANDYKQIRFQNSQGWREFVDGKMATTPEAVKLAAELKKRTLTEEEKRILWVIEPHPEFVTSEESCKVKAIGVWDTVGALGVPDGRWMNNSSSRAEHGFHNVKLNKNIEHAFQALALDERRKAFSPTLWYIPKERPEEERRKAHLLQVWFPGVHINIGGGSSDTAEGKGDAEQMANITFAWMVECVRPYLAFDGAAVMETMDDYAKFLREIRCKNYHHHHPDPSKEPGLATRAYNSVPSVWEVPPQAPLEVRWGTAHFVDSCQGVMAWAGATQRKPGECGTEIVVEETSMLWKRTHGETRMDVKLLSELGETNEQVHPVARFRREKLKDKTGGLKEWTSSEAAGGGFEWSKGPKGDLVLKEYVIGKNSPRAGDFPNFERLVAGADAEAAEFLEKTDQVNSMLQMNGKEH